MRLNCREIEVKTWGFRRNHPGQLSFGSLGVSVLDIHFFIGNIKKDEIPGK